MESYGKITLTNETTCYKLSCVIQNTPLTPLKWIAFIDEFNKVVKRISEDDTIKKFYMYFDINYVDVLMKPDNYKDIINIFKDNQTMFLERLLGTFIYIDSNLLNMIIHIFIKFYSPVKPLFILKSDAIDQTIINDLLENRKNKNEYIFN